jgi:hypothetical protein
MQDPLSQIRLPAKMKSLEAFLQFVSTYARRYGIIRKLVDETRYRREGKNNIVTFIFSGKDEK